MADDPRYGPGGQSGSSGYSYSGQNGYGDSAQNQQSGNNGYRFDGQSGKSSYQQPYTYRPQEQPRPTAPGGVPYQPQRPSSGYYPQNGYHYQYGNGMSPKPQKQKNGWSEWLPLAILFLLPFAITKVIAVILFFSKIGATLSEGDNKKKYQQSSRQIYQNRTGTYTGAGKTAQQPQSQQTPSQNYVQRPAQPVSQPQAQSQQQPAAAPQMDHVDQPPAHQKKTWLIRSEVNKRLRGMRMKAIAMMVAGGILSAIFGMTTIAFVGDLLSSGFWNTLAELLLSLAITAGGAFMLGKGFGSRKQADRIMNYLGYIGDNQEIPLASMAASFGVPVKTLCNDLRLMLAKGILPEGYLDLADGKLYLTDSGYRGARSAAAAEPAVERPQKKAAQEAKTAEKEEDDILRQIREVNDQIPDAVMSAKIDRIEEITRKILAYQKAHPDREPQLRSFLNYYLPTTLKILRAYAQLDAQGIEGENINMAKKRIENMMDQAVAGYEKQLDKLFSDDVMDITTDVEVLENMLRKDGLADDGITLTL